MKTLYDFLKADDKTLISNLKMKYPNIQTDSQHNYFYIPGMNNQVCFVAHIDTVRHNKVKLRVDTAKKTVINKRGILGADDRAGVYLALLLHKKTGCPVLLTNYEETGCQGVQSFIKNNKIPNQTRFQDTKLFIELDRHGTRHYVTYYGDLPIKYSVMLANLDLAEKDGTISDVYYLTEALKIPSINLAIGYYNAHSEKETLHLLELQYAETKSLAIVEAVKLLKKETIIETEDNWSYFLSPKYRTKKQPKAYYTTYDTYPEEEDALSWLISDINDEQFGFNLSHKEINTIKQQILDDSIIQERIARILSAKGNFQTMEDDDFADFY